MQDSTGMFVLNTYILLKLSWPQNGLYGHTNLIYERYIISLEYLLKYVRLAWERPISGGLIPNSWLVVYISYISKKSKHSTIKESFTWKQHMRDMSYIGGLQRTKNWIYIETWSWKATWRKLYTYIHLYETYICCQYKLCIYMYVHMHKLVRFKLVYRVYWGFKAQYTICLQMFSYRPKLCMCRRSAWYKFIDSLPRM